MTWHTSIGRALSLRDVQDCKEKQGYFWPIAALALDEFRQVWSMVLLRKVITDVQLLLTFGFWHIEAFVLNGLVVFGACEF